MSSQTVESSGSGSGGGTSNLSTPSNPPLQAATTDKWPSQTSISFMDDLVKEYLVFRGFQSTLKSLEHELKSDKSNSFRADKCTDLILSYIHSYDLASLLEFWLYLEQKFISRVTIKIPVSLNFSSSSSSGSLTAMPLPGASLSSSVSRKYELFILRYYLVYAMQTSRQDKAVELLEHCANKLQGQPEWRDWYMLPFLKNPEENAVFSVYFSRNWIDTFIISLQNFLNVVFQSLPFPRLLNYDEDAFWIKHQQRTQSTNQEYLQSELIDEFQLVQTDQQNRPGNTLINMIRNLTTTSKTKTSPKQTSTSPYQPNAQYRPRNESTDPKVSNPTPKTAQPGKKLEKIPDETTNEESSDISSIKHNNEKVFDLGPSLGELQPLPDLRLEEPKLIEQAMSGIKPVDSYLNLSQEDYCQHKSPILQCKFSNDGKYVASVDSQGFLKIWSVESPSNTVNTLTQKSSVLSIEWDVRNYNILYIGTRSYSVKVYDVQQKKIIQDLSLNKSFPLVTLVRSFSSSPKILIFSASKLIAKKDSSLRNSQITIGEFKIKGGLSVEKNVDFESYFYQSCVGVEPDLIPGFNPSTVIFGCSDGYVRFFNLTSNSIVYADRLHQTSVLNLVVRKNRTLISLSVESIKLNRVNSDTLIEPMNTIQITNNCIERLNINAPFHPLDSLIVSNPSSTSALSSILQSNDAGSMADLRSILNASRLIAVDTMDRAVFCLDKSGVYVGDLSAALESNEGATGAQLLGLANSTTFDLWNSNHLSILLIGSMDGTVRFFRLLHQF